MTALSHSLHRIVERLGEGEKVEGGRRGLWLFVPAFLLFVVVIPLCSVLVGGWLDGLLRLPHLPPFPLNLVVGVPLAVAGGALCVASIWQLYRLGRGLPWGDAAETAQSTRLITTGLYAHTRNPMVLGYLVMIDGLGWLLQSLATALLVPVLLFLLVFAWLKVREEPALERRFGQAYREYKRRTPLLIPRPWRRGGQSKSGEEGRGG